MEGLPFLPGYTFNDPTKNKFHVSNSLGFKNGLAQRIAPKCAVGGMPLHHNNLSEEEMRTLANYNPTLTYGQVRQAPPEEFVPAQVAYDKKVLRFHGWLKETVNESPDEHYRVRRFDLYYYLEDDSIMVEEHKVKNMGITQGVFIRRQRIPKDDVGGHWLWTDLNNGVNVTAYGKVIRLYDCDRFTSDWLESQGIVVNGLEECPDDPYIRTRTDREAIHMARTPSDFDSLRQFLEMDRRVLRYYAVWDDRDQMYGDMRKFVIHYFLVDDTLEVREVRVLNDGRDPFPILIQRHRCPKDRYDINPSFPLGVLEPSDLEYCAYFSPIDFKIGETVLIYNRRFLIYDFDNFTRAFYWKNFGMVDFSPIDVTVRVPPLPKKGIPPYNMHGSLDDSMQNVRYVLPPKPKVDYMKMIDNQGKILRFEAFMDTTRREDRCRRFIIQYTLSDDTFSIYEPPIRNSGIQGGKFLTKTRIAKPGSSQDRPVYYGPADLHIGAVVELFTHRFVITSADSYVLKYMEDHPNDFPKSVIDKLRERLKEAGVELPADRPHHVPSRGGPLVFKRTGEPDELEKLVNEVKIQLRKLAFTGKKKRVGSFLSTNSEHRGYLTKDNLVDLCVKHHLPCDADIIDCLARQMAKDPERVTLDEFMTFLEHDKDD